MNNKLIFINNNFFIISGLIFLIFVKIIYSFNNGYVAPDTEWFLKVAELIYENKSLFYFGSINMQGYETDPFYNDQRFAGTWPPLYPSLIALVKILTGLSYYWSSKIINILCLITLIFYFNKKFENKLLSYFILLNATLIEVLCFSLTEYVFITILVFATDYFYKFIENNSVRDLLICLIFSNLLFLTRYNGLYIQIVFIFFFIVNMYTNKNLNKNFIYIILFFIFNFIFTLTYLFLLNEFTGSYSGSTNRELRENFLIEIIYIMKSIVVEMNYLISDPFNVFEVSRDNILLEVITILSLLLLQILPLLFFKLSINFKKLFYFFKNNRYVTLYSINIIFYFLSINSVIFIWVVDHLYYRSMSPIVIMGLIILTYILKSILNNNIKKYIIYLITLSSLTNFILPVLINLF